MVMKARRIEGIVYRIKTSTAGYLVEIPDENIDPIECLARYCAALVLDGCHITSVTRILERDSETPRVSVLSSKEFKDELKLQWKIREESE